MYEVKIIPNLVFKYNYEPGFDIKKFNEHLDEWGVSSKTVSERDGGITTAGNNDNPHFWPSLTPFMDWLKPKIEIALNEWDVAYDSWFMSKSWVNRHTKNSLTDAHEHGSGSVVVSCYVKQPSNGGNIMFETLLRERWVAYSREDKHSNIHDYWREVAVNTNDVLLFPGWITHKTQANQTDEDRIVFTINIGAILQDATWKASDLHIEKKVEHNGLR